MFLIGGWNSCRNWGCRRGITAAHIGGIQQDRVCRRPLRIHCLVVEFRATYRTIRCSPIANHGDVGQHIGIAHPHTVRHGASHIVSVHTPHPALELVDARALVDFTQVGQCTATDQRARDLLTP